MAGLTDLTFNRTPRILPKHLGVQGMAVMVIGVLVTLNARLFADVDGIGGSERF